MASPPPAAIRPLTNLTRTVDRILHRFEHYFGPNDEPGFSQWAQGQYGLTAAAARQLFHFTARIASRGFVLDSGPGVVPRGDQYRNPAIPQAYRVRAYAVMGASDGSEDRYIPHMFDFDHNPTRAEVRQAINRWFAQRPVSTFHRGDTDDPVYNRLKETVIRSLECRTC